MEGYFLAVLTWLPSGKCSYYHRHSATNDPWNNLERVEEVETMVTVEDVNKAATEVQKEPGRFGDLSGSS